MKSSFTLVGFVVFIGMSGFSQSPRSCVSAIPILNGYYNYPDYTGLIDPNPNEINGSISCLANGESNGRWFEFEILDSGMLSFNIIPYHSTTDYDWALYNLTNAFCVDIYGDASLQVRCNYSNGVNNLGITGANGGPNNQDEPTLNVSAGDFFKLYVSNFTEDQNGFQINMNASTCTFNQTIGINEISLNDKIHLGPNPTQGLLNLSINTDFVGQINRLQIADLQGRIIYIQNNGFSAIMPMDLANEAPGVYFVQISTLLGQHSIRLIVQ